MGWPWGKTLLTGALLSLSLGLYAAHVSEPERRDPAPMEALDRLNLPDAHPSPLHAEAMARLEQRLALYPDDLEASLLKGMLLFKAGRLEQALAELEALTRRAPRFHLAHLVQGDLLLTQAQTVSDIGVSPLLERLPDAGGLAALREEAGVRLRAYLDSLPQERLPRVLLGLGESVRTALVVDKRNHRLYVYERAAAGAPPRLVRDYYVSTGKLAGNKRLRGDLKTPEGVYFFTGHIPDSRLPDKYGVGAFPTNYPNELDRHLGKTGDGIWLHGTERDFYSRPPLDSEGCVVLPNPDLLAVSPYLDPGHTPVVIAEQLEWVSETEWQALRGEVLAALEAWRADWESGDVERYLDHYSRDFWADGYDYRRWSERKRLVAQGKRFQQVALSDLSLFAYPPSAAGRELVVVNFQQDYRSNNFDSNVGKRLYLAREEGGWKVLYEGSR